MQINVYIDTVSVWNRNMLLLYQLIKIVAVYYYIRHKTICIIDGDTNDLINEIAQNWNMKN